MFRDCNVQRYIPYYHMTQDRRLQLASILLSCREADALIPFRLLQSVACWCNFDEGYTLYNLQTIIVTFILTHSVPSTLLPFPLHLPLHHSLSLSISLFSTTSNFPSLFPLPFHSLSLHCTLILSPSPTLPPVPFFWSSSHPIPLIPPPPPHPKADWGVLEVAVFSHIRQSSTVSGYKSLV